jgi:hypothetical protein
LKDKFFFLPPKKKIIYIAYGICWEEAPLPPYNLVSSSLTIPHKSSVYYRKKAKDGTRGKVRERGGRGEVGGWNAYKKGAKSARALHKQTNGK